MTVTREERTQRLHEGSRAARAAGRRLGGEPPYGWRHNHGTLAPVPGEQAARWLMLHLARHGWTSQAIADQLNELSIPNRVGTRWTRPSVHRIVRRGADEADTG